MSLIFIKVDRDKKIHSIYSDGIRLAASRITSSNGLKILEIDLPNCNVLFGCAGVSKFCNWIKLRIANEIQTHNIVNYMSNRTEVVERISDMMRSIWETFCEKHGLRNDDEQYSTFGCIMSINGILFKSDSYGKENIFDTYIIDDRNYGATGQEEVAALCLLENGIEPQKVFDTISKFNCYINNNMRVIENVKYEK